MSHTHYETHDRQSFSNGTEVVVVPKSMIQGLVDVIEGLAAENRNEESLVLLLSWLEPA